MKYIAKIYGFDCEKAQQKTINMTGFPLRNSKQVGNDVDVTIGITPFPFINATC